MSLELPACSAANDLIYSMSFVSLSWHSPHSAQLRVRSSSMRRAAHSKTIKRHIGRNMCCRPKNSLAAPSDMPLCRQMFVSCNCYSLQNAFERESSGSTAAKSFSVSKPTPLAEASERGLESMNYMPRGIRRDVRMR